MQIEETKADATATDESPVGNIAGQETKGALTPAEAAAELLKSYSEETPEEKASEPASEEVKPEAEESKPEVAEEAKEEDKAEVLQPAESETEAEDPEDAVLSKSIPDELKDKVSEIVRKRIAKSLRKEHEARELAEKAKAEIEATKREYETKIAVLAASAPVPASLDDSDPIAQIADPAKLVDEEQKAKRVLRDVEELLDSDFSQLNDKGEPVVEVGGERYTKQQLKAISRNARRTLEDKIPAHRQFLEARSKAEAAALNDFPFLRDPKSKEYITLASEFRRRPALKQMPDGIYMAALAIKGLAALEAERAATGSKKVEAKPAAPKAPTAAVQAPAKAATGNGKLRQELDQINKRIRSSNLSVNEAAKLQARRSEILNQLP